MPSISWTTVAWSACGATGALLALIQVVLWIRRVRDAAHILAATACLAAAATAMTELSLMKAATPEQAAAVLRVQHVPLAMLVIALGWFVHTYFRNTGRWWPVAASALWSLALVFNFLSPGSLVFERIEGLRHATLLGGEGFVVPYGTVNPLVHLANLGVLVLLGQSLLAARRAWRSGKARSAVVVGGSISVFLLVGGITSSAIDSGWLPGPYVISFCFLAIALGLSYEVAFQAGQASDLALRAEVAEHDLLQLRREAERADRINRLGELAAVLAHELNQPLAAVLSNAQAGLRFLSADEPDLPLMKEILDDIVRDDKRAGDVIHGMRALMQGEGSRRQPMDLRPVIEEVVGMLEDDVRALGVVCTWRSVPDLPVVEATRVELQQILINLVRNALDSLAKVPAGARSLSIEVSQERDELLVSVADTGAGIPESVLPELFQPLTSSKPGGIGMGLAICKRIVESLGGRIGASNAAHDNGGGGARVWFRLPSAEVSSGRG